MTNHTHLKSKKIYSSQRYRLSISNSLNVKNIEIYLPNYLNSNVNALTNINRNRLMLYLSIPHSYPW